MKYVYLSTFFIFFQCRAPAGCRRGVEGKLRLSSSSSSSNPLSSLETVPIQKRTRYYVNSIDESIYPRNTDIKSILVDKLKGTIRLPPSNFEMRLKTGGALSPRDVIVTPINDNNDENNNNNHKSNKNNGGGGGGRNLIHGGIDASKDLYPYFVTMYEQYCEATYLGRERCYDFSVPIGCGGTLVAADFAMTAAHCFPSISSGYLIFEIGSYCDVQSFNTNNCQQRSEFRFVNGYKRHPEYIDLTPNRGLFFDIMLFRFDDPTTIQPVQLDDGTVLNSLLPMVGQQQQEQQVTALGFGTTFPDTVEQRPLALQQINLTLEPNDLCNVYEPQFGTALGYPDVSFCASSLDTRMGTCKGDSGGPIIVSYEGNKKKTMKNYNATEDIQLGITSFGFGTCGVGYYTKVGYMYDWIRDIICTNSAASPTMCTSEEEQEPIKTTVSTTTATATTTTTTSMTSPPPPSSSSLTTTITTTTTPTPLVTTKSSTITESCVDNPNDKITITMEVDCSFLDNKEKLKKYCYDPTISDAALVCKYRCRTC